jgi:hypothetical protein
VQKETDLLLCLLGQTGEPRPTKLILLTGRFVRKDRYEYVAQKLSSLSATVGKETSRGDCPLRLR